jgi:hypothetical protein
MYARNACRNLGIAGQTGVVGGRHEAGHEPPPELLHHVAAHRRSASAKHRRLVAVFRRIVPGPPKTSAQ